MSMKSIVRERKDTDQILIDKLILLCEPESLNSKIKNLEAEYIKITDLVLQNHTDWHNAGEYSQYIELSDKAIDYNLEHTEELDLNSCVATLICIHREQHFASADVIRPRLQSGKLLKLAKQLKSLVK